MHNAVSETVEAIHARVAKVERPRLHDAVVGQLRDLIVEGALASGSKLNERELCATFGISRTPLREAMKVLAAEGLIDIEPHRGASVSRMTESEVAEAFELMSGLEALSGELAAVRISDSEIGEIKALHASMAACRADQDLPGYYALNQMIHHKINVAARNSLLSQTFNNLNRRLTALRFKSNHSAAKWERAMRDHEAMIAALEARDGARLAAILRQHLLDKRDVILAGMAQADAAGG